MNVNRSSDEHLTESDLFLLAFPPAGEPGVLPAHLAGCGRCGRRLAEWERAAREIAGRPGAYSADFESAVMARVRALPAPGRRRPRRVLAAGIAAAAVIAAAIGLRNGTAARPAPSAADTAAPEMGARDRADDALLRDVSRLVSGEDPAGWKTMAPLPDGKEGRS